MNSIKNVSLFFLLLLGLSACMTHPRQSFVLDNAPEAPDYSQEQYWAALPWTEDAADSTPDGLSNEQAAAAVDVFFLHPTTYTGKRGHDGWNGPVSDERLNERTLESPIKFQASIFNGSCRVFAPFYRQAHLHAYYTEDTLSARKAFDLAYADAKRAFEYYLEHYNEGRPIVIASHSQGTTHSIQLLQDFFDGTALQQQLVAAYIVGIPVLSGAFETLQPCADSLSTGCYISWRTFKRGYEPKQTAPDIVVTNPLSWVVNDEEYVSQEENVGAVIRPFEEIIPAASDAQVHGPVLWASKPKFPGSWLLTGQNFHIGDMNIYYMNIRENVALRSQVFLNGGELEQETDK